MAGAQAIHANVYATQPLAKFGTQEQISTIIPNIINGQWRTCFGVTEPNVGGWTLPTLRQWPFETAISTECPDRRSGSLVPKWRGR